MYLHEVSGQGEHAALSHFREEARPSGLVVVQQIGETIACPGRHDTELNPDITLPDAMSILMVEESRGDTYISSLSDLRTERYRTLEEFTSAGIRRFSALTRNMPAIAAVSLRLVEISQVVDDTTARGITVIHENPETSFVRYAARPDEIEAMEPISNSVTPRSKQQPDVGTTSTNYL